MTDERMGDALFDAIDALPRGSGIVFRHYSLPLAERHALFAKVSARARRRRHVVIRAGTARFKGEDGVHNGRPYGQGIRTASAHSRRELLQAKRQGADLIFVSPLFVTRSHPGQRALGQVRFGHMVRNIGVPVIALGGMNARRAASLRLFGIYGWAAINAWTPDQKRNDVPT